MKKLNLFILTLLIIRLTGTMAQQLPNTSYFMYDYTRTNPGSFGSKDMVCVSGILKNSLQGFGEGSPKNLIVNADIPFNLFNAKHGVGISFIKDELGFYNNFELRLGYAFRFKVADGTLGLGVNGVIRQNELSSPKWVGSSTINPDTDPNIPQGSAQNYKGFGAGVGLFYRSEDIYLGASVSNIYSSEIKYEEEGKNASETIRPHYYLMAGYNYQLSNPAFEISPAVTFYSDGSVTTFDVNGTLTYNKKVWGGVSYRAGSAVVGMVGFMIMDGLKVGAAYDYSTSALSQHSVGGWEVLLNYCFKLGVEKSPQRYRSIRYL